jgi:hypothetical protein
MYVQETGVRPVSDDSPDSCNTQLQPASIPDFSFAAQAAVLPPFRLDPLPSDALPPPKRASQVLPPVPWPPSPFEPAASLSNPYETTSAAGPSTPAAPAHGTGEHYAAPAQYPDAIEEPGEPQDAGAFPVSLSDVGLFSSVEGAEGLCDAGQWQGFAPRIEPGFSLGTSIRAAPGNNAAEPFAREEAGRGWPGMAANDGRGGSAGSRDLGAGIDASYPGRLLPRSAGYGLDPRGNFPLGGLAPHYGGSLHLFPLGGLAPYYGGCVNMFLLGGPCAILRWVP